MTRVGTWGRLPALEASGMEIRGGAWAGGPRLLPCGGSDWPAGLAIHHMDPRETSCPWYPWCGCHGADRTFASPSHPPAGSLGHIGVVGSTGWIGRCLIRCLSCDSVITEIYSMSQLFPPL